MSTSTNAIFTGTSTYSQDFQNLITRAVSIASLPITQLTNEKTALGGQSSEISTLNSKFSALQSTITGIDQALNNSCVAASSAPTVVSASAGAGAVEANYSILVSDVGAYSTMMTGTWKGAGTGAADSYQLWIGGTEYDFTPADNSAASVASAINATYGDKVHATVVNVGSNSTPDYRVSLQSEKLTTDTLDLRDGGSLATSQTAGWPARYEIDGSGTTVSSDTRTVNVADGVTLTLLDKSATAVNVNVTRSTSGLGTALSLFANAYNAAVSELGAQRGQSGGPLAGQSIVMQLSSLLSGIGTYSGDGLSGLSDLGLDLGSDGKLTFDQTTLDNIASSNGAGVAAFLGSASGGGFLKAAGDTLTSIEDPTTGLLATTQSTLQSQITDLSNSIDNKQTQVDALQTRLQQQMAAADAAIAAMQQQYGYMSNMFQAMQTAAQQSK